ncbi:MAG: porin family protein [Bacteroidota bacterium]
MKRIRILVLLGSMSISSIGIAQNETINDPEEYDHREEITFALKAGLNFSNVYNSRSEEFRADGKFGFAGGAALTIPIGKYLGVQPEILLSQKGFKGNGVFLGSDYSFTRTTTYLDIPLQVAFKPASYLTIVAGPQYSYLLKQEDDFNNEFLSSSHEEEFENENIRNNILGVVAGIDFNLKDFVVSTRVGWDITNNHGDGSSSTPQYKNLWMQATIGYVFHKN